MKTLRSLATRIAALQQKARALGLFADDRDLLECPACGLLENVAAGGGLFTLSSGIAGRGYRIALCRNAR